LTRLDRPRSVAGHEHFRDIDVVTLPEVVMRSVWIVALLLLLPSLAAAQMRGQSEITAQAGWQYGGTQDYVAYSGYTAGDFHANAALNFGGLISRFVQDYYAIEVGYSYQQTDLVIRPNGFTDAKIGDLATHYIQLYGTRYVPVRPDKADAFVMAGLGGTGYYLTGYNSRWLTSFAIGGGVKFHLSEKAGLRLQTRLLLPVQWSSGGFYFGNGGAQVTVGGSSTLVQGDVSLGFVMKMGG